MMRFFLILFFFSFYGCLLMADEIHRLPLGDSNHAWDVRVLKGEDIYDSDLDKKISWEEFLDAAQQKQIVVTGESHTNWEHHLLQVQLIEGLTKRGKKVVVGMEFFEVGQQGILDAWSEGKLTQEQFLEETNWFNKVGYNYRYYRPILEVAKKYKLAVVALNIDRAIVHKVSQQGLSALSEAERSLFPKVDTSSRQHRYLIQRIMGKFALLSPEAFDRIHSAQCVWDEAMAHYALQGLQKQPEGTMLVVIAGSGHVIYDLGIPSRLAKSPFSTASLIFHEIEPEKTESSMPKPASSVEKPATPKQSVKMTISMGRKPASKTEKAPESEPQATAPEEKKKDPHFKMDATALSDSEIVSRSLGRWIFATKASEGVEKFPMVGVKLAWEDGFIRVVSVSREGIAAQALWEKGDRILSLNEMPLSSLIEAQTLLTSLDWQDVLTWKIEREGKEITGAIQIQREKK